MCLRSAYLGDGGAEAGVVLERVREAGLAGRDHPERFSITDTSVSLCP